jgi:hypothetical protein
MSIELQNPNPDDAMAQEAAMHAREVVRAIVDGERGFTSVVWTEMRVFIERDCLNVATQPDGRVHIETLLDEFSKRQALICATLATLAALAIGCRHS